MSEPQRGRVMSWEHLVLWRDGEIDLDATRAALPCNEQDCAMMLATERLGELHYVPGEKDKPGTWYVWDLRCHRPDKSGQAKQMIMWYATRSEIALSHCFTAVRAKVTAEMPANSTQKDTDKAIGEELAKWADTAKFHRPLKSTARSHSLLAKLAEVVSVSEEYMADRWPEYLNCRNGVVHLRTGVLYPHDPRWMMTYCLDVDYVPGARGGGWEALLWHVAGENANVARYLIRMLGYSCLGDNREQLIFFMKGPTASGKSQVLEAVLRVLGPLAHSSTGALISRQHQQRHARVEYSILGKRFVFIDESAERIKIDEGQLKRLTGSGVIAANRLFGVEEVQAVVSFAIWQGTNEMPTLPGFDDAIRRRIRCIPCGSPIPAELQVKKLGERLAAEEGEAILAMLVAGCMDYFTQGEARPDEVERATIEYETEQDTATAFRQECTMDMPLSMNGQGKAAARVSDVHREYVAWCRATSTTPLPKHAFNKAFQALPGIIHDENQRRYVGIVLVSSYHQDQEQGS